MRRAHDIGGLTAGPIDTEEHDYQPWEKRVKVMVLTLAQQKVMTLDELRRGVEDLGEKEYNRLSYYQRWTASSTNCMIQKGIVSVDELGDKMKLVEARWKSDRKR